ncbi:Hypothetical protein POVR1_LOCUS384 [uncultured virus]|nr:Hypothetical protein POVR1_LOCUS384 [uncultured virus]
MIDKPPSMGHLTKSSNTLTLAQQFLLIDASLNPHQRLINNMLSYGPYQATIYSVNPALVVEILLFV